MSLSSFSGHDSRFVADETWDSREGRERRRTVDGAAAFAALTARLPVVQLHYTAFAQALPGFSGHRWATLFGVEPIAAAREVLTRLGRRPASVRALALRLGGVGLMAAGPGEAPCPLVEFDRGFAGPPGADLLQAALGALDASGFAPPPLVALSISPSAEIAA